MVARPLLYLVILLAEIASNGSGGFNKKCNLPQCRLLQSMFIFSRPFFFTFSRFITSFC